MEGDTSVIRPNDVNDDSQNCELLEDPFMAVRGLAFLYTQISTDRSSDDDTKSDHRADDLCVPTLDGDESLFILEEEDLVTEHSKLHFGPETTQALITNGETNGCKNGESRSPARASQDRFRCHTRNIDHLYCTWHGAKYCCRANEPNDDNKWTMGEDNFDNCLNYLECSDVMTDGLNGIWQSALLGSDPVFLLESDQDDETKVSLDSLHERDPLLSGVTLVDGVSNNNALTGLCDSHSEPPPPSGELPEDSLKALQPEMVITVGHQQDNTSNLKRQERCSLPLATAAIQNDQAGIEEESKENSPVGDISACAKQNHSSTFMEMYLANVLDTSVKDLVAMADESTANSLIYACPEEKEYEVGKGTLEADVIIKENPRIPAEHLQAQEAHRFSLKSIPEPVANSNHSIELHEAEQDQGDRTGGRTEYSHIVTECAEGKQHSTTDPVQEHIELIHFLKESVCSPESFDQSNGGSKKIEVDAKIWGLEETKKSQTENPNERLMLGKHQDYISVKCNNVIEDGEPPELPTAFGNCIRNEIMVNGPQVVDKGTEIINTGLQFVDKDLKFVAGGSQILDSELEIVSNSSQILDNELEIVVSGSQTVDNKLEIVSNSSQILDNELEIVANGSQIVNNELEILTNISQFAENELEIVDNGSQIVDNELEIVANGSQIVDNDLEIVTNISQFAENELEIVSNGSQIVANELEIVSNSSQILDNELEIVSNGSQIVANELEIVSNSSQILDNELEIVANGSQIVANELEIVSNSSQILDNELEIVANGSQIMTNELKIVSNGSQILDNELEIVDHGSQIADNELEIVTNVSQITDNELEIVSNSSQILDNELEIVANGSQIVENELEIVSNSSQILDNELEIVANGSQFVANELKIVANASQFVNNELEIVANGSQIVNNKMEIVSNGSHILDNELEIVANGSQIPGNNLEIVANESKTVLNELEICPNGSQITHNKLQIVANESQTADKEVETQAHGSQIADNKLESGTQIVDIDSHVCGTRDKPISNIKCQDSRQFSTTNTLNVCERRPGCLHSENSHGITNSLSNAHIDVATTTLDDLCGQVTEESTTIDMAKKPNVLNGANKCSKTSGQSSVLMVDNKASADDTLRTNSVRHIKAAPTELSVSIHQAKDLNIKKKVARHFSLSSICSSFNKGDQEINGKIVVEHYQGDPAKKPLICRSKSSETLSLVKMMVNRHNNSTEMEKAPSRRVRDYIPNSTELSQVCRVPGTIRGAGSVQADTSTQDQTKGASSPAHFMRSTSLCEKNSESRMVKKKFKSNGIETKGGKNAEPKMPDGNEVFPPEEGKRVRREKSTETATTNDSIKAPQLLHSIEAEMFPDCAENLKLFCHFGEIHADSTITWTKDSKLLARIHRSSNDDSTVSLAIVQTSKKDQGLYHCTLKNVHGKVTTEFHLTAEVLEQLTRNQEIEGGEEIEFNQLFFREDFITDMYFGGNLHGRITTEDLHFGEGVHRKAFRSKVMCGLLPVFSPGHLCVLKVHNAIAYGTKSNDELVQKNYKLAVQECYVQNTAREYAKIYASEAEQLEEFGKVPEIIPIFLIHRPVNNIPYATVEEELIGDFVKYSIKDGKEINVMRRDSEAGQKCCTFQHWVYEKTSGNLLVTDMQGVGMKLTDVGIATLGKGYKGFKGNCSVSFIDQFKVLHQCNKYCEILGLKSLRPSNPKVKRQNSGKEKAQPIPTSSRKSRHSTKAKNKT